MEEHAREKVGGGCKKEKGGVEATEERRWRTAEQREVGKEQGTAALPRAGRPHAHKEQRWGAPLGRSQYLGEGEGGRGGRGGVERSEMVDVGVVVAEARLLLFVAVEVAEDVVVLVAVVDAVDDAVVVAERCRCGDVAVVATAVDAAVVVVIAVEMALLLLLLWWLSLL